MSLLSMLDDNAKPQVLYVKDKQGVYRLAPLKDVLITARRQVGKLLPRGSKLNSTQRVKGFLNTKLSALEHETFAAIFLDAQLAKIEYEEIFKGTINQAQVYPRELAKMALEYGANGVIIAHNHPSGFEKASASDIHLTKILKDSLSLFEIKLLDHIIVAGNKTLSFAEEGLL